MAVAATINKLKIAWNVKIELLTVSDEKQSRTRRMAAFNNYWLWSQLFEYLPQCPSRTHLKMALSGYDGLRLTCAPLDVSVWKDGHQKGPNWVVRGKGKASWVAAFPRSLLPGLPWCEQAASRLSPTTASTLQARAKTHPSFKWLVGYLATAIRKVTNTMCDNIGNSLYRGYKMKILELIFTKGKTFFLKVKSPL